MTFASDRRSETIVLKYGAHYSARTRHEIFIATSNLWFQPKYLEFTFVEELIKSDELAAFVNEN